MVGVVWGGSGFVGMVAVAGMVAGKVARRSPLWMVLWRVLWRVRVRLRGDRLCEVLWGTDKVAVAVMA